MIPFQLQLLSCGSMTAGIELARALTGLTSLERCAPDTPGAFIVTDGARLHWDGRMLSHHNPIPSFTPLTPLTKQDDQP